MQPVGVDEPGLLLVRGPNIMQGYLNKPEKTADVLRDGWYNTGDIARLDEDGFLKITDRLSRFSKIGGEMVPHIKVEDLLQELAGASEQTFVVTAIPDEKKGERLIVLHTLAEPQLEACLEKLGKSDLPVLWRPRPDQFVRIEKLPYLGTGKLDLRKARELALEMGAACAPRIVALSAWRWKASHDTSPKHGPTARNPPAPRCDCNRSGPVVLDAVPPRRADCS